MFWADQVSKELLERKLKLEWVDDMKTPSGKIHVGALRGVVVHDLVYKALKDNNVNAKYTYIFDDQDPMDDLPTYLPEEFRQYLGQPLFTVKSPDPSYESYAQYYALDFKKVFNAIDCEPEIIWASNLYKSGKLNPVIKECLDQSDKIKKIYEKIYEKKLRDDWFPFKPVCQKCGKIATTRVFAWDGEMVHFVCEDLNYTKGCQNKSNQSPFSSEDFFAGKLPWKVEWAAKWKALGVTVEGAGKDHMSKGGSHDLASLVAKDVLRYPVPYPVSYEWFLVGGRKMSTSKGVGVTASEMLEILPPEILRFLMVRYKKDQQINFDPDGETIPKLFDDYQKAAKAYFSNKGDDTARIFELSQLGKPKRPPEISFMQIVRWYQSPNMHEQLMKENVDEWLAYVKIWIDRFASDDIKFKLAPSLPETAKDLTKNQKEFLLKIDLSKDWDGDEFQKQLFEWAKESNITSKEAFSAIYLTLIGKNYGPKAGWIILQNREFARNRFKELQF